MIRVGCGPIVDEQRQQPQTDVMQEAMAALLTSDYIRGYEREVVADTFSFGTPFRDYSQWASVGGPAAMRRLGQRLSLPVGGGADPGDQLLLSLRPAQVNADSLTVFAVASFRTRDLHTRELTDNICLVHYRVVFSRSAEEWSNPQVLRTATSCGVTVEDRERWAQGLPPLYRRPDRP
jgi:hypothetical protein